MKTTRTKTLCCPTPPQKNKQNKNKNFNRTENLTSRSAGRLAPSPGKVTV